MRSTTLFAEGNIVYTEGVTSFCVRKQNDVSLRLNDVASKLANDVVSLRTQTQKRQTVKSVFFGVGTFLFSRAAARQVSSAQVSLTSVFGMGTGGPSPQSAPTIFGCDF